MRTKIVRQQVLGYTGNTTHWRNVWNDGTVNYGGSRRIYVGGLWISENLPLTDILPYVERPVPIETDTTE